MGGPNRKLPMPQHFREKIQASAIINRLTEHIHGRVEMAPSQVTAALGLLKKCVPDLAAITVDHTGEVTVNHTVSEQLPLDDIRRKAIDAEPLRPN